MYHFSRGFDYFLVNKPYGMLSQFRAEGTARTLADLGHSFPKNVYPVGRLDADSEGLLILTNDKRLNYRLLHPEFAHKRTYYVQVEQCPETTDLDILRKGMPLRIEKKEYHTKPANVQIVLEPDWMWNRQPPIRSRMNIPTCWLKMQLIDGKNRQIRKMTAAIGHPTLRLIRYAIEQVTLRDILKPGSVVKIPGDKLYRLLNIKSYL